MSPLTWTEPEQSGASECCLYVARRSVDDDEMRVAYRPAAPSDVAAELEAMRALMRWTRASEHRWVTATHEEWLSRDIIPGAVHDDVVEHAPTPQALAAKLGAK